MGKSACDKNGLKKGPWTPEEDQKLIHFIHKNGYGNWRTLPNNAGLERCGKSCRLRWTNYLRPGIKRGSFSFQEEETIIHLHSLLGNKWSAIAGGLPGRTDNEIKNYWNTHIRKRLLRMGIDPITHSPCLHLLNLDLPISTSYSQLILNAAGAGAGVLPYINPQLLIRQLLATNSNSLFPSQNKFRQHDHFPLEEENHHHLITQIQTRPASQDNIHMTSCTTTDHEAQMMITQPMISISNLQQQSCQLFPHRLQLQLISLLL